MKKSDAKSMENIHLQTLQLFMSMLRYIPKYRKKIRLKKEILLFVIIVVCNLDYLKPFNNLPSYFLVVGLWLVWL